MTPLSIFSKEEIELFESPPRFTAEERKYFFLLPEWAENLIATLPTPASKIGFVLQLGYFRATNKFYPKELFYPEDSAFAQRRLGHLDAWQVAHYTGRTMRRHRTIILMRLGYTAFSPTAAEALSGEAGSAVEKQIRLKDIFGHLLDVLEQRRLAVPSYSALATIITTAFRKHEKRLLTQLVSCLTEADKQLLDDLLSVDEVRYVSSEKQAVTLKRSRVTLLKKFHQSTRPGKIRANIDDLLAIKDLFTRFAPVCDKLQLSRPAIEHYATITINVQHFQIERRNELRYLYLLCFIVHQYYTLNDLLIETLVKVVQTATNNAKKAQEENYFASRDDRLLAAGELATASESANAIVEATSRIVFAQDVPDGEKIARLKALLGRTRGYSSRETRRLIARQRNEQRRANRDADYFDALGAQSHWLQNRVSEIVRHVRFNEDTSQKAIMAAIAHFQQSDGKVSARAPVGCFSKKERQAVVIGKKGMRVSLYKALLFKHIGKAIKSERLNVKYSYTHRALGDYMIAKELWRSNKADYLKRAGLEKCADFPAVMQELKEKLEKQYEKTNRHSLSGENQYLTVRGTHDFTLTTPRRADEGEDGIDLYPSNHFVSLTEVLVTMNQLTHFLDAFQPVQLTHVHQRPSDKVFLAVIIGLGRNNGIAKMAKISRHISQSEMERALLYLSPDNVSAGSDTTLAFLDRLPITHLFDRADGIRHAVADGQKLTVSGDSIIARRSYKYFGNDPGITSYQSRDSRDFLYHSTVFSPTDREAWYAIDVLMHNTIVKADWFSTDTHGVTPLTFAAMHFLGVFFAPRIAGLEKRTRSSFVKRRVYQEKGYLLLPDALVNEAVMEENWDDMLRFMATILLRVAPASQLFQRLNSNARKHPLYQALNEFGHIIETISLLRNIDEVEIRQAGEKELNKMEHINRFSKAVFKENNHVMQQETRELQLIADGCRRLIQNNIIGYNYLLLSQRVADTPEGKLREALLKHIQRSSMAVWHHIHMDGEYDFSDERVNTITPFHLSKILGLKIEVKQEEENQVLG